MSSLSGGPSGPNPVDRPRPGRLLVLAVVGLCALYTFPNLDRGWIPHDEGTLAHSAERVLQGEVPHRDFDEVYTGGLTLMHAVAFKVLGVNLFSLRLVLFGFFLAWVPTLIYVTSRFAGPPTAALAVFLAMSWSLPVYPAAMPSWYNLFFAGFGLAALLRYLETEAPRWLFAAGLAGGVSILMKTSGLFFVAATLLFLAYREQTLAKAKGPDQVLVRSSRAFSLAASTALLLFVALLVLLVGGRSGAAGVVQFVVPFGAISAFLLWSEWSAAGTMGSPRRFVTLLRLGGPFLAGVLVPVGGWVLAFALMGAGGDLVRGLFVLPSRRFTEAAFAPPSVTTMWVVLPLVALLVAEAVASLRVRRVMAGFVLAASAAVALAPRSPTLLSPMWDLMNALGPLVVLGGVALLVRWKTGLDVLARQRAVAVLAVAAGAMMIQFPYSGAIYLFYALPALVPAALMVLSRSSARERPVFVASLLFFLVFSARWIDTGELFEVGHFAYNPVAQTARLGIDRGGYLRVSPEDKEEYETLVTALRDLSTSPYVYATPDVSEVYFLSGLRNPTPTFYEFFDDPDGRTERILNSLDSLGVNVVVLNGRLRFSGPPSPDLLEGLRGRYPKAAQVGGFIVRWRDEP